MCFNSLTRKAIWYLNFQINDNQSTTQRKIWIQISPLYILFKKRLKKKVQICLRQRGNTCWLEIMIWVYFDLTERSWTSIKLIKNHRRGHDIMSRIKFQRINYEERLSKLFIHFKLNLLKKYILWPHFKDESDRQKTDSLFYKNLSFRMISMGNSLKLTHRELKRCQRKNIFIKITLKAFQNENVFPQKFLLFHLLQNFQISPALLGYLKKIKKLLIHQHHPQEALLWTNKNLFEEIVSTQYLTSSKAMSHYIGQ